MQYWNTSPKLWLLVIILISNLSTQAQENSPYSRYGIGNLKQIENVANKGMGGISIADDNSLIANPTNPATYSNLKLTSYSVGMEGSLISVKNGLGTYKTGSAGLGYLTIGFPINNRMGLSFGLLPQTRSKYNMEKNDTLDFATSNTSYAGGGGLQKFYIGTSYKYDDFSIGFNTGYTFGNLTNGTLSQFTDTLNLQYSNFNRRTAAGGLFYQIGGLMNKTLKDDYVLRVGITYMGTQILNAKRESEWANILNPTSTVPDTVYYFNTPSKGKISLPSRVDFGVLFAKGDHWQVGFDINSADWTKYRSFNEADSTGKYWNFKLGGSFTPDPNSVTDYWKKMTFRAGFYTGQDILSFNNTNMKKSAVTIGAGYPIRRTNMSIGQVNVALETGARGTVNNGLLREGFTRFSVGMTFNDKWFIKRKYD